MQSKALRAIILFSLLSIIAVPVVSKAEGRGQAFVGRRAVVIRSYPYWGWGDPFWGGYYAPYYYPVDNRGKIKIKDEDKLHQVYINGAFAGTVEKMKNIRLDPGRYNVEIRDQGKPIMDRQVYVVTGKTVEINVNRD